MDATKKLNMLLCVPPRYLEEGTICYVHDLLKSIQPQLDKYVNQPIDIVTAADEYDSIAEDKRYQYDMLAVQMGGIA